MRYCRGCPGFEFHRTKALEEMISSRNHFPENLAPRLNWRYDSGCEENRAGRTGNDDRSNVHRVDLGPCRCSHADSWRGHCSRASHSCGSDSASRRHDRRSDIPLQKLALSSTIRVVPYRSKDQPSGPCSSSATNRAKRAVLVFSVRAIIS